MKGALHTNEKGGDEWVLTYSHNGFKDRSLSLFIANTAIVIATKYPINVGTAGISGIGVDTASTRPDILPDGLVTN